MRFDADGFGISAEFWILRFVRAVEYTAFDRVDRWSAGGYSHHRAKFPSNQLSLHWTSIDLPATRRSRCNASLRPDRKTMRETSQTQFKLSEAVRMQQFQHYLPSLAVDQQIHTTANATI